MGLHKLSYNIWKDQLIINYGLVCPYPKRPVATGSCSWSRINSIPGGYRAPADHSNIPSFGACSRTNIAGHWFGDCLKISRFTFYKSMNILGFADFHLLPIIYQKMPIVKNWLFPPRGTMSAFIDSQLSMAMGFGLNGIQAPYFYYKFQPFPNFTSTTIWQYLNS